MNTATQWRASTVLAALCATGTLWKTGPSHAASSAELDAWTISADNIDATKYYGVSLANGMMGILSSPEPFQVGRTLINGAYDGITEGTLSQMVSTFDFLELSLSVDGEPIEHATQITHFRQRLDMKRAVLDVSFDYRNTVSFTYSLRILRHMPYTGLLELTITTNRPVSVTVTSHIGCPPELKDVKTFAKIVGSYKYNADPRMGLHLQVASGKTQFGRHAVAAAQGFIFDEPLPQAPRIDSDDKGSLKFSRKLPAGGSYHLGLVGSTLTTAHVRDPVSEAQRLTVYGMVQSTRQLIASHERAWAELWKSDIRIEGDDQTQRDVRSMIYHLYSSVREGSRYSIPPMGLTGTGYFGHIFWDADSWMLPTLLVLKPSLARSLLDYRFDRLPAARANAASHGYRGALFPWETADTGEEETLGFFTGPTQQHITADVALAAWDYYRVTRDLQWLQEEGWPLIKETADFWLSRVERNGPGRYEIKNVVAADEYAEGVDNDAFTNAAARANLAAAMRAANVLGVPSNPDWEDVRRNIPILEFPDGTTREHATYNGETIKQADPILLAYPLRETTDPKQIRRDLDYYLPRYDNLGGPSYSKGAFAVLYHRLGMTDKAFEVFKSGYVPNQRAPFGVLSESPGGQNPYLVTNAGGLLQAVLFGFGGLDITDMGLVQKASGLPKGWKSLTLTGIGPSVATYVVRSAN